MSNVEELLSRKSKAQNNALISRAKKVWGEYKESGDSIRFATCPNCQNSHPNNMAFSVNLETANYYCHDCGIGGHLSSKINGDSSCQNKISVKDEKKAEIIELDEKVERLLPQLRSLSSDTIFTKYLRERSIDPNTWSDISCFKEGYDWDDRHIVTYPFIDKNHNLVALQRIFIDSSINRKIETKYCGPKGLGIAILSDRKDVIVAEGLENALSIRQHLGTNFGIIVCGDADNMTRLAHEHSWALQGKSKIILAADNDISNVGILAAQKVFCKFPRAYIYLPSRPQTDWNDLLQQRKIIKEWL